MIIVTAKHKVILEPIDFESDLFFSSSPPKTDNCTIEPYFGFPKSTTKLVDELIPNAPSVSASVSDIQSAAKTVLDRVTSECTQTVKPAVSLPATTQTSSPNLISVQINLQVSKDFTLHVLVLAIAAIGIFMLLHHFVKVTPFC